MKTTIKHSPVSSIVVHPHGVEIVLAVQTEGLAPITLPLTIDQAGALLFGLEQAAQSAEQARMLRVAMGKARAVA